jgi:predicted  nucleic acid-binding Zn-ribbon protein
MGAILEALHRLQQIETELNTYRTKEQSLRRKVRQAERLFSKAESACAAQQEAVQRCQMEIDQADLDINSREESMNKHRQALNAAKSNKEYAAILTALNTEKADTAKFESRVLELMAQKEKLISESKGFEDEKTKMTARIERAQKELDKYLASTHDTVANLEADRTVAAEKLPVSAIDTFDRVAARHDGDAMAETVRVSSRGEEHICSGCNMSIPLEHVNRLRSLDEILVCSSCGRILYVDTVGVQHS